VFFTRSIEVEFDDDHPYDPFEFLDQGFNEINEDFELVPIKDVNGQFYNEPRLLDGLGFQSLPGEEPNFISVSIFKKRPFATLFEP